MSDVILSIENVSKEYQLGTFSAGTFSGDLQRWWYKARGREDPYKKIGANDRSKKTDDEFVLALQDINLEVKRGEILGIIGKNGAGKSTLLKLLSRVTSPTTGRIRSAGRMASLLEVGTGFHPELTGMENIFLNGAILGMTKAEIKRKLDEIIDFSGCAQYIDTPVKRYSSGMRVRLGFAVAAFLDPEILVVDEVLAVGDAEFQKKAIGKMKDISQGGGRTVLFVSHNMASVRDLCTRALILNKGMIEIEGETEKIVDHYLDASKDLITGSDSLLDDKTSRRGNGELRFTSIVINDGANAQDPSEVVNIIFAVEVNIPVQEARFKLMIRDMKTNDADRGKSNAFIFSSNPIDLEVRNLKTGSELKINVTIPKNTFRTGLFPLYFGLSRKREEGSIGGNYPYDVVDSVQFLNFKSKKSISVLGYDPIHPFGYVNLNLKVEQTYE